MWEKSFLQTNVTPIVDKILDGWLEAEVFKNLVMSTSQTYSVGCHGRLKKPEAGISFDCEKRKRLRVVSVTGGLAVAALQIRILIYL